MKKIVSIFLIAAMIFCLTACGAAEESVPELSADTSETADAGTVIPENDEGDSTAAVQTGNVLVA